MISDYVLHHVTVTIMVTVATNTTNEEGIERGKGRGKRKKRKEEEKERVLIKGSSPDSKGTSVCYLTTLLLSFPLLHFPLYICMIPSYLHHLQCITTKSMTFIYICKLTTSMSNSWRSWTPCHCMLLSHIGQVSDTLGISMWPMAPPRVMPTLLFKRLGTRRLGIRRLGTGSFSISYVDWPSQCSLWIPLG
jgi:hypothetical protein